MVTFAAPPLALNTFTVFTMVVVAVGQVYTVLSPVLVNADITRLYVLAINLKTRQKPRHPL